MIFSLGLIHLLEWLIELRKPVYSWDYWFISKDIKGCKPTARRRAAEGWAPEQSDTWKGLGSPTEKFSEPHHLGFVWSLCYTGTTDQIMIKSSATESTSSTSSPWRLGGGAERSTPFLVCSPGNQLILRWPNSFPSHFINTTWKETFMVSLSHRKSQGF